MITSIYFGNINYIKIVNAFCPNRKGIIALQMISKVIRGGFYEKEINRAKQL